MGSKKGEGKKRKEKDVSVSSKHEREAEIKKPGIGNRRGETSEECSKRRMRKGAHAR